MSEPNMGIGARTFLLLLCSVTAALPCLSAEQDGLLPAPARPLRPSTTVDGDTTLVRIQADSTRGESDTDTTLNTYTILVDPPEATQASVRIIQTSRVTYQPYGVSTNAIAPDTLGQWTVPLRIALFPGEYTLHMGRSGYKSSTRTLTAGENRNRTVMVRMEILSFEYLQTKQRQWSTTKWISAGVSALTGAATWYLNHRITTLGNEYSNATIPDGAKDLREQIVRHQDLYSIVSAVALTALGATLVSWIIEWTYSY